MKLLSPAIVGKVYSRSQDSSLPCVPGSLRVGLSAAPCCRRVRVLAEAGIVKGYHADIDRHKIGTGVLAFVRLDANGNNGELTRQMEEAIRKIPEIVSCGRSYSTSLRSSSR
jgi:Lrp/AsnC family leucine-responsive transcriptional regulator